MSETPTLQASCAICFEDLRQTDKISAIVCGHIYHNSCISQWIATKKQCPSCRRTVPKNGFVEKLFFDVQRIGNEQEKPTEIDYREEHYKLSTSLKVEQEKLQKTEDENKNLKTTVKSLEKKIIREKDKYNNEIPKLKATINHLTISSEETDYLKREVLDLKNKLKTCEFYKILTIHHEDADRQMSEYLRKNGSLETENFFKLIKAQNKDLAEKRKEAAKEIESLKNEISKLKQTSQEDKKDIGELKKSVLDLRERANVETPITNKRLRSVMETETPPAAKRKSLGFDQTIEENPELSFFTKENKTPETSKSAEKAEKPGTSKGFTFDFDEDDEYFRTPKIAQKVKKVEPKPTDDSFDFAMDIPVPSTIMTRITMKPTGKVEILKQKAKSSMNLAPELVKNVTKAPPLSKTARISSFFQRTKSASAEEFITLE